MGSKRQSTKVGQTGKTNKLRLKKQTVKDLSGKADKIKGGALDPITFIGRNR
jgi:hypothetical protein